MGEIIPFPASAIADPNLSASLAHVRNVLRSPRADSSDVLVIPLIEGYNPYFTPDGSMHLAEAGLQDFTERFNAVGSQLYTNYFAWRHEIEAARKVDNILHQDLLTVAEQIRTAERLAIPRNIHDIELDVIGTFAARVSIDLISKRSRVKETSFRGPANRQLTPLEIPQHETDRRRALGHIAGRLSGVQEKLLSDSMCQLVQRRKTPSTD